MPSSMLKTWLSNQLLPRYIIQRGESPTSPVLVVVKAGGKTGNKGYKKLYTWNRDRAAATVFEGLLDAKRALIAVQKENSAARIRELV